MVKNWTTTGEANCQISLTLWQTIGEAMPAIADLGIGEVLAKFRALDCGEDNPIDADVDRGRRLWVLIIKGPASYPAGFDRVQEAPFCH